MADNRNTTAQGDAFRDGVNRITELTRGCTIVNAESQIGKQSFDLYYEERTSFRVLKFACECKDYDGLSRKTSLANNLSAVCPAVGEQRSRRGAQHRLQIGATAGGYAREIVSPFDTFDQLESEIIDFRHYLRSTRAEFAAGDLHQ